MKPRKSARTSSALTSTIFCKRRIKALDPGASDELVRLSLLKNSPPEELSYGRCAFLSVRVASWTALSQVHRTIHEFTRSDARQPRCKEMRNDNWKMLCSRL